MVEDVPISTKWLKESIKETESAVVDNVFMIICPRIDSKGTGFLYKQKYIITNWHVVESCSAEEIIAVSSTGASLDFKDVKTDRDLALLTLEKPIEGGLKIDEATDIKPGIKISTWGYPLKYNGPSPLLSVGYISGFRSHLVREDSSVVKRIVVNGAFNPGNSGGPLLVFGTDKLLGVVVSKHTPITKHLESAIRALSNNKSGIIFEATDEHGNTESYAESQVVAELLNHLRELTQVMIGEAIDRSELIAFLKDNKIY